MLLVMSVRMFSVVSRYQFSVDSTSSGTGEAVSPSERGQGITATTVTARAPLHQLLPLFRADAWCSRSLHLWAKLLPHSSHLNRFWFWWMERTCLKRLLRLLKNFPHTLHWFQLSSWSSAGRGETLNQWPCAIYHYNSWHDGIAWLAYWSCSNMERRWNSGYRTERMVPSIG